MIRYTALADRAASDYAPVVRLTALAAFYFWLWAGAGVQFAIDTAIAVLAMSLSSITVTLNAFRRPKINKGNAPDLFQPQQRKAS